MRGWEAGGLPLMVITHGDQWQATKKNNAHLTKANHDPLQEDNHYSSDGAHEPASHGRTIGLTRETTRILQTMTFPHA